MRNNFNDHDFESSFSGDDDLETMLKWTEIAANGLESYFSLRGYDISPVPKRVYKRLEKRSEDKQGFNSNLVEAIEAYKMIVKKEGAANPRLKTQEFINYDLPAILDDSKISAGEAKRLGKIMFQVFFESVCLEVAEEKISRYMVEMLKQISTNISEISGHHKRDNYLVTLGNFIEHNPKHYSTRMSTAKKMNILSRAVYKSKEGLHQLDGLKPDRYASRI